MKVYVLAAIAFFLSALLSTAGYQIDFGCFFIPGFAFGLALMLLPVIRIEHKIGLLGISTLAYCVAVWSPFLEILIPKRLDIHELVYFPLAGFGGGTIICIYLCRIGVKAVNNMGVLILSISLSSIFTHSAYPLLGYETTIFEMCYPWVTWQVGVGLAIVYAYRNTFSETDSTVNSIEGKQKSS